MNMKDDLINPQLLAQLEYLRPVPERNVFFADKIKRSF